MACLLQLGVVLLLLLAPAASGQEFSVSGLMDSEAADPRATTFAC